MQEVVDNRPARDPSAGAVLSRKDIAACLAAGAGASFLLLLLLWVRSPERMGLAGLSFFALPLGLMAAVWVGQRLKNHFPPAAPASRFGVVGILNTSIDLCLLSLLVISSGVGRGALYALFKAASFLVAATNSYLWNKHWSFACSSGTTPGRRVLEPKEFLLFLSVTAVGLGINTTVATVLVGLFAAADSVDTILWGTGGAAIASMASAAWDFLAYRHLVFERAVPTSPLPRTTLGSSTAPEGYGTAVPRLNKASN